MRAFMISRVREGAAVGATYAMPRSLISDLDKECSTLTVQARCSFGVPPPPFKAFTLTDTHLHVPRFYGLDHFGPAEFDQRTDGTPVDLRFEGTLTPLQEKATEVAFGKQLSEGGTRGAMICLACGQGKTVWAVHAAARIGRKTLVVVHKGVIRDQWEAAFLRFCPGCRVGFIQGATWQVEGCDVVIAMVMTLAKRGYDASLLDEFGTVVVDECHHMAAPVMNLALRSINARNVIALTATKDRPDGLTPLLHWGLGPEVFRADRSGAETVRVSIALYAGATQEILTRDGKPLMSLMLNRIAEHPGRNAFIADRVATMRHAGRVILVLSHRLKQLEILRRMLFAKGLAEDEVGVFKGGLKKEEQKRQLDRPVVLCSYQMADEGVDKVEADTCVMATPKRRVTQCIGRIQRPCATKQAPIVVDVVDDVSVFAAQRWARQKLYRSERYELQVLRSDTAGTADWFA